MTESRLDVAIIDDDDGVRESLMLLFEISDINAVAFASAEAFLASTAPRDLRSRPDRAPAGRGR